MQCVRPFPAASRPIGAKEKPGRHAGAQPCFLGGDGKAVPEGSKGALVAVDVTSGDARCRHEFKYPAEASALATAGGLVFTGDIEGYGLAFDALNGDVLWRFNTGSAVKGSPISYAMEGKQYITIPSGWGGVSAALQPRAHPELADIPLGSALFVFALRGD